MSKTLFVISTKIDNNDYGHLQENIKSILENHDTSDICVVDSDSSNKDYMGLYENNSNVFIEDIANHNYEYGAIMHAFGKYAHLYDTFVFMQDSVFITGSIYEQINAAKDSDQVFVIKASRDPGYGKFAYTYSLINYNEGIHNDICICNTFIISTKNMTKIVESDFFKNRTKPPIDKHGSCHWERIWSICWHREGLKTIINGKNMVKKLMGRQ